MGISRKTTSITGFDAWPPSRAEGLSASRLRMLLVYVADLVLVSPSEPLAFHVQNWRISIDRDTSQDL